jgi:hypothetical protein
MKSFFSTYKFRLSAIYLFFAISAIIPGLRQILLLRVIAMLFEIPTRFISKHLYYDTIIGANAPLYIFLVISIMLTVPFYFLLGHIVDRIFQSRPNVKTKLSKIGWFRFFFALVVLYVIALYWDYIVSWLY